jgi:hypothetical protein
MALSWSSDLVIWWCICFVAFVCIYMQQLHVYILPMVDTWYHHNHYFLDHTYWFDCLIHDKRLKIVTLSALIFEDLVKLCFVETLCAIHFVFLSWIGKITCPSYGLASLLYLMLIWVLYLAPSIIIWYYVWHAGAR